MKKVFTFLLILLVSEGFAQRVKIAKDHSIACERLPASRARVDTAYWAVTNTPTMYPTADCFTNYPVCSGFLGYIAGIDGYGVTRQDAQVFDNNRKLIVYGAKYWFGIRTYTSNDTNSRITFKMYALDSTYLNSEAHIVKAPGTVLAQTTVKVRDLKASCNGHINECAVTGTQLALSTGSNNITFPTPVAVDGDFAMGFDVSQVMEGDTFGLVTSSIGDPNVSNTYEHSLVEESDFNFPPAYSWHSLKDSLTGFGANVDLAIFPIVDQTQYDTISAEICNGNAYVFAEQTLTQSGKYRDSVVTVDGLDSITVLNLTVLPPIDSGYIVSGDTFIAKYSGFNVLYQWLDCSDTSKLVYGQNGPAFVPVKSGSYELLVSQFGCRANSSCFNTDISCKAFFTVTADQVNQGHYTITDHSIGSDLHYTWEFGDDSVSHEKHPTYSYLIPGRYNVCLSITGDGGCTDSYCDSSFYALNQGIEISSVNVELDGISEVDQLQFSIQPNPVTDICTIIPGNIAPGKWTATLYNMQGQLMKNLFVEQSTQKQTFSIAMLPAGVYMVKINSADGKTGIKKLVKE